MNRIRIILVAVLMSVIFAGVLPARDARTEKAVTVETKRTASAIKSTDPMPGTRTTGLSGSGESEPDQNQNYDKAAQTVAEQQKQAYENAQKVIDNLKD